MPPLLRCWVLLAVLLPAIGVMGQPPTGPTLMPPPAAASLGGVESLPAPVPAAAAQEETLPPPEGQKEPTLAEEQVALEGMIDDEETSWYQPMYWLSPAPWDTGLELGLNGSSGTSESLSIRTGGYVKRESRFSKLNLNSYYNRTTSGGEATQNNANLDARNDWLLDDSSPWTLYGTGNLFYDEFQAFDAQLSANTGVGYRFVHEPELELMTRFGGGTSREFGGPDDRWVPESLLGFEYSQQLAQNQKFYGKLDYYPEWEEIGEYRLIADTGWEIELIQPSNLSLRISASDRFDSTPNGVEPHLINYSVLLLLKL